MDAKLRRYQLRGFLFTSAAGTLLHFLYDWSGRNSLIAAISTVNESVWEHMKILFIPMFIVALVEMMTFSERYHCFWRGKLLGILTGLLLIPMLYYTYTGALGIHLSWVDISIYFIAAAAAYFLETKVIRRCSCPYVALEWGAMLLVWLLAFIFLLTTYAPPHLPIFQDPVTLTYGLS